MAYKQMSSYFTTTDVSDNVIPIGYKEEISITEDYDFTEAGEEDIFHSQVLSPGVYSFTLNYILQAVDASGCEIDYVQMTMLPAYEPECNLVRWSYPDVVLTAAGERNTYSFNGIFNITETTNVQFATEVVYILDGADVVKRTGFSMELIKLI
jgi:hypothetical protein